MENIITNRLRLVETTFFEGRPLLGSIKIPWFEHEVPVVTDRNQEIYRDEKHIGSVNYHSSLVGGASTNGTQSIKARKGDIIYCISLNPQPYTLTGIITTKDGYRKMYEISFQIQVNNSRQFIEKYHRGKDPVAAAIHDFKTAFERYFSGFNHDEIDFKRLGYGNLNKWLSKEYGLLFLDILRNFHIDYQREKELEIWRKTELRKREVIAEIEMKKFELTKQAELRRAEIITNAELSELEKEVKVRGERIQKQSDRDERRIQNDFSREEKIKSQLNEARIQILTKTVHDLTAINTERIRDAFDSDTPVRLVLEDSLKLLAVFVGPNQENEEVIDAHLSNDNLEVDVKEESNIDIRITPTPTSEGEGLKETDQIPKFI